MGLRNLEFHKSSSYEEAEKWDILQQIQMTPQERLDAANELKARTYPDDFYRDVREYRECLRRK